MNEFLTYATSSNFDPDTIPVNNEVMPCISDLMDRPLGPLFSPIAWFGKKWFRSKVSIVFFFETALTDFEPKPSKIVG